MTIHEHCGTMIAVHKTKGRNGDDAYRATSNATYPNGDAVPNGLEKWAYSEEVAVAMIQGDIERIVMPIEAG